MKNAMFLCFLGVGLGAGTVFQADFNQPGDLNAQLHGKKFTVGYNDSNQRHQTLPDTGRSGRAIVVAKDNLKDFRNVLAKPTDKPLTTLVYRNLSGMPRERGSVSLSIAPYCNDNTPEGKVPHNYFFHLSDARRKSILTMFIVRHETLVVQFNFTNGKSSYLYASLKKFPPRKWIDLAVCWDKGSQKVYVEGKIAAEKAIDGALDDGVRLELGGRDGSYHTFHGLIDEVVIRDNAREGLPAAADKSACVPLPGSAKILDQAAWKSTHASLRATAGTQLTLVFQGGRFADTRIEGGKLPVTPGSVIRGDLEFRKKLWDYTSYAPAEITFYKADGTLLERHRFDHANIAGYVPYGLYEFQTPAALREKITYFNFWRVPAKAAYLRPGWMFRGNPAAVEVSKLTFGIVDASRKPWAGTPGKKASLVYKSQPMPEAGIDALLKNRPLPQAKLRREGDHVELYMNGKRTMPLFAHNTMYNYPDIPGYTRAFARMGLKFVTCWVGLAAPPIRAYLPCALGEDGKIDVSPWRQAVRKHISQNPDGYVMLALSVHPPKHWLDANPGELMADGKGVPFVYGAANSYPIGRRAEKVLPKDGSRMPSFCSEKYRTYITEKVREALLAFEQTPEARAVAGIYLLGGDDAQFRLANIHTTPDLSPVAVRAFREFLKKKYRTDEALRRAWNDARISFETVRPPVRPGIWPDDLRYYAQNGKSSLLADYKDFYSRTDRVFKTALRKAAKDAAPRLLVGGYDCAYGMSGSWGHTGLHFKEGIDDAADFYIFIPSYSRDRDCADIALGAYQFSHSLVLHKKLGIMELDVRNPEIGPLYWGQYRSANYVSGHNADTFAVSMRRLAVQSMIQGGGFHYYNLQPHWCRTPRAAQAIADAARIAAEARPVKNGRDAVALMIDESSNLFSNLHPHWVPSFFNFKNMPLMALQRAGMRYQVYQAADALHPDFKAPGVLFFADAGTLEPRQTAEIRKRFGKDKRVIVWHGAPGFLTEGDMEKIGDAINFRIGRMPDYASLQGESREAAPVPLTALPGSDPLMKDVQGYFTQESTAVPLVFSPHWFVRDDKAKPLAVFDGTRKVGMAVKRHKDFTEIFIGQPGAVTPRMFRNFAREAGFAPCLETDDLFYCGSGLLAIGGSLGGGVRTVRLPEGFSGLRALSGHPAQARADGRFDVPMKYNDFAVFKLTE